MVTATPAELLGDGVPTADTDIVAAALARGDLNYTPAPGQRPDIN